MAKLTISGTEIEGVTEARSCIFHANPKAPDPVPLMEWRLRIRLQHKELIPKWAMAPQSSDRFKKCILEIQHSDKEVAHTWTLLKAYVHEYEEVEHPGTESRVGGEAGHYLRLTLRGQMPEVVNYTGENVMTVAEGGPPKESQ